MTSPIFSRSETMTGRVRLRIGLFRRVIAQVEVTVRLVHPASNQVQREFVVWRDAKAEDVVAEFRLP